jgi:RNA polymerase sigma factor (sigma-70 family)
MLVRHVGGTAQLRHQHGGATQVQYVRARCIVYDPEDYYHARNLRCAVRVAAESVAANMGVTSGELSALEATDIVFWSRREMRSYAEALGFAQWRVTHKDGRCRLVIAQFEQKAAREACWQPKSCASIEKVPEPCEWRVAEEPNTTRRTGTTSARGAGPDTARARAELGYCPSDRAVLARSAAPRECGDTRADKLIAEAEPIVRFWALKYKTSLRGKVIELDDLLQEAKIAVLAAARSYDPGRCVPFRMHATSAIRHALRVYVVNQRTAVRAPLWTASAEARRDGKSPRLTCSSLDAPVSPHDASSSTWLDMLAAPEADGTCNLPAKVVEAVDALPPREREALLAHLVGGTGLEEIGRRLGVTKQRAAHLEYRAIERITDSVLGRRRDADGRRLCDHCGADISERDPTARYCKKTCRQRKRRPVAESD